MALLAGSGESRVHVIGIRGAPEVSHVAARAIGRRQIVIVVHMALRALQARVSRGQRESCDVMVKVHRRPVHGVVASGAVLGELRLHVIGVLRSGEVLQVATDAIGDGDLEVPVDVTGAAIERCVHSRESEAGELAMVEPGPKPRIHGVAGFTRRGKLQFAVVRDRRRKRLSMARNALSRQALKLAYRRSLVALIARQCGMSAHEREAVLMILNCLH